MRSYYRFAGVLTSNPPGGGCLESRLTMARRVAQFGSVYAVVRDQIFLPKAGASEEEVLLRRRQLATEYKASVWAGLGFRFGSPFNSIVNSRLDQ